MDILSIILMVVVTVVLLTAGGVATVTTIAHFVRFTTWVRLRDSAIVIVLLVAFAVMAAPIAIAALAAVAYAIIVPVALIIRIAQEAGVWQPLLTLANDYGNTAGGYTLLVVAVIAGIVLLIAAAHFVPSWLLDRFAPRTT